MASTLTVKIENGEAVVTADGTKMSCDAAAVVERAIGQITRRVSTGKSCDQAIKMKQSINR